MAERDLSFIGHLQEDLEFFGLQPDEIEWRILCLTSGQSKKTLEEYKRERQRTIVRVAMIEVRMRGELGGD